MKKPKGKPKKRPSPLAPAYAALNKRPHVGNVIRKKSKWMG